LSLLFQFNSMPEGAAAGADQAHAKMQQEAPEVGAASASTSASPDSPDIRSAAPSADVDAYGGKVARFDQGKMGLDSEYVAGSE
jgi:hypothetical protein